MAQAYWQRSYILLSLIFLLSISCAAKITRLYHASSFTAESIISSKMAVGGVTSIDDDLTKARMQKYSSLLRVSLAAMRKDISFAKENILPQALGDEGEKKILDEYSKSGTLSDSSLGILKRDIKGVKYLIFARIEEDDFWAKRTRRNIYDYEYTYYRERPVRVFVGVDRRYRAYRAMTVSMSIYDIYAGKLVWGATLSDYLRNVNSDSDRFWYSHLSSFSSFSYPDPPEAEEILKLIFDGFAINFPGAKQGK